MRNHFVEKNGELLKDDGSLREPGWSKRLVQNYDRKKIKANPLRIKEWDYYAVLSGDFGVAFTVSDLGFAGLHSVSFLDFRTPTETTKSVITVLPLGKTNMPSTSETGDVHFSNKDLTIDFIKTEGQRRIVCLYKNFIGCNEFKCDITLEEPMMDTMVIATPWKEKKTAFYYNQKINCMPASGSAEFDGKKYVFNPAEDFGTLDWGRGVWTYDNRWYWSSGNQRDKYGKAIGFNLGYGFTDRSSATENMFFYDGKAHKLDEVKFVIPTDENGKKDYMKPWKITSNDGRFECDFTPILNRSSITDLKVIVTDQNQVFGRLNGYAKLDDGTPVEIKDMLMFAEDVRNKY